MKEITEIRVHRQPWANNKIAIHIFTRLSEGRIAVAESVTMRALEPIEEGQTQDPAMLINPEDAQQWMDELWRAGIRPSDGSGSTGQLAATQAHLDDMRRLVFRRKA